MPTGLGGMMRPGSPVVIQFSYPANRLRLATWLLFGSRSHNAVDDETNSPEHDKHAAGEHQPVRQAQFGEDVEHMAHTPVVAPLALYRPRCPRPAEAVRSLACRPF